MRKLFLDPEVNTFEFSPADSIMVSGENHFAVDPDGPGVPTIEVPDPAAGEDGWA